MKYLTFLACGFLIAGTAFADTDVATTATATTITPDSNASFCTPNQPQSSAYYEAAHWYRDSAERNALYREIFMLGQNQITRTVQKMHFKQKWGVVFDIDETLLDNTQLGYQSILNCQPITPLSFSQFAMTEVSTPLPGAVKITCGIQKMGGYVTLISNRDGTYIDPATQTSLLTATQQNLKKAGICFNQVILASGADWDKNARFTAARTGVYPKDMVYSNKLPAHPIIAYFGDNIQDFPNLHQSDMIQQNANGPAYDPFGRTFFVLPNPTYGSWQANPFQ